MKESIDILMLEDAAQDAELIMRALERGGLKHSFRWTEADDEFFVELRKSPPDVVLSDHGAASFDSFTMLDLVRDRLPGVPFIFVTGSLTENMRRRAMQRGAAACISKDHLTELVPIIRRSVEAVENRKGAEIPEPISK